MVFHCKLSEVLYYAFFLLLFTTRILGLYEGNLIYSLVLVVSMICFLISYLMTSGTRISFFFDSLLMLLAFASWLLSGEKGLLLFFSMMIGVRRISLDRLFKIVLSISGTAYALMIMLGAFGVINEFQNCIEYRGVLGYVNRRTISPLYINIVMEPYLVLIVLVLYLIRDKGKKTTLIVSGLLLVGLSYLFGYCVTFSSYFIGIVLIVIYLLLKRFCNYSEFFSFVSQLLYLFFMVLGVAEPYLYDSAYGTGWTFARRFQIGHYYLQYNTPTFWGSRVLNPDPEYMKYGIHQSQLHLLLQYGIVLFVIVNFLHYIAIRYMVRKRDAAALSAIFSFSALGIVEPLLFNLSFKNIVFVFVGKAYGEALDRIAAKHISLGKSFRVIPDKELSFAIRGLDSVFYKVKRMISNRVLLRKTIIIASVIGLFVAGIVTALIPGMIFLPDPSDVRVELYNPIYDHIRLIISSFMWTTIWAFILLALLSKNDKDCYHIGNNIT